MAQIGELFVALGVKGAEKTITSLSNVKININNIASASLEAKAAILAAAYALEKLTVNSTTDATKISNLGAYIQESSEWIQKWGWAAKQGQIGVDEFRNSLKSMYDVISTIKTSGVLPKGFGQFEQSTGLNLLDKNLKIDQVLPAALKFAKDNQFSKEARQLVLQAFGLTPNEIANAMNGKFNAQNANTKNFLSNNEVDKLAQMGVELGNLETKVSLFFSHFTAKNKDDIITVLKDMTDAFLKLATAMEMVVEKLKLFKIAHKIFKLGDELFLPDEKEIKKTDDRIKELYNNNKEILNPPNYPSSNGPTGIFESILNKKKYLNPDFNNNFKDYLKNIFDISSGYRGIISPPIPLRNNFNSQANNSTINQNLYFQHPGKDAIQTKSDYKLALVELKTMINNSRST